MCSCSNLLLFALTLEKQRYPVEGGHHPRPRQLLHHQRAASERDLRGSADQHSALWRSRGHALRLHNQSWLLWVKQSQNATTLRVFLKECWCSSHLLSGDLRGGDGCASSVGGYFRVGDGNHLQQLRCVLVLGFCHHLWLQGGVRAHRGGSKDQRLGWETLTTSSIDPTLPFVI